MLKVTEIMFISMKSLSAVYKHREPLQSLMCCIRN